MNDILDFGNLFSQINSFDKYLKLTQVATQSLWQAVLDIRAGLTEKKDVRGTHEFLVRLITYGREQGIILPEVDVWWSGEVLEAFEKLD